MRSLTCGKCRICAIAPAGCPVCRSTNREETHRINTTSYHFLTFAFLPLLAAAKTIGGYAEPGNIVNIASLSGLCKTSQRGQFNYNSGK